MASLLFDVCFVHAYTRTHTHTNTLSFMCLLSFVTAEGNPSIVQAHFQSHILSPNVSLICLASHQHQSCLVVVLPLHKQTHACVWTLFQFQVNAHPPVCVKWVSLQIVKYVSWVGLVLTDVLNSLKYFIIASSGIDRLNAYITYKPHPLVIKWLTIKHAFH